MPLTHSFQETIRARAERDPTFREALFQEAMQTLLQGDTDYGRTRAADLHQCHYRFRTIERGA
ncbi:hypothetical protein ACVWW4_008186 [Bradyrhizobium sp. LB7.1]